MRRIFILSLLAILAGCHSGSDGSSGSTISATSSDTAQSSVEGEHKKRFAALVAAKEANETEFKRISEQHSFTQVIPGRVLGDPAGRGHAYDHIKGMRKGKDAYFAREDEIDRQLQEFSEHKFGKGSLATKKEETAELSKLWDKVLDAAKDLVDFAQKHNASYDAENNSIVLDGDEFVEEYNRLLDTYYLAALKLEKRTKEITAEQKRRAK